MAEFVAVPVEKFDCPHCGTSVDAPLDPPFTPMPCPSCSQSVRVPARFDNYLLSEILGRGTSGTVFRGRDTQLNRDVAVKVLKSDDDNDEKIALECVAEARALASLNDPNIVHIYTIGLYKGQHYIVMELVTGGTGEQLLRSKEPLSEVRAIDFAIGIASGLNAAHRAGLVHMDVKPGNALLTEDGRPKLIDFGAAMYGSENDDTNDRIVGTPYYIAPEVVDGQRPDFKADIYSLGASLYHLLTGRPPFTGQTAMEVMKLRLKKDPVPLSQIRPEISRTTQEVVRKMMARRVDGRYLGYEPLLEDLRQARHRLLNPEPDASDDDLLEGNAADATR